MDYLLPDPRRLPVQSLRRSYEECRLFAVLFQYDEPEQFTLILQSTSGDGFLVVNTGYIEACSVYNIVKYPPSPFPVTHELILNIAEALGGTLLESLTDEFDEATSSYRCRLAIGGNSGVVSVRCRISDAVALSLLSKIPLKIDQAFLNSSTR